MSCLSINCRIQPFSAQMAGSLDNGVGGDSNIKSTVFSLSTGDPKPNFTRHDFKLSGLPSQNLLIFATPDTSDSRVALVQARIHGCYVRTQKDVNALAMCFRATFGPVGRDELELVHSLFRRQTFVTFEEGEPILGVEDDDDAPGEIEDVQTHAQPPLAAADQDAATDEPEPEKRPRREPANRRLHSHQSKSTKQRRASR